MSITKYNSAIGVRYIESTKTYQCYYMFSELYHSFTEGWCGNLEVEFIDELEEPTFINMMTDLFKYEQDQWMVVLHKTMTNGSELSHLLSILERCGLTSKTLWECCTTDGTPFNLAKAYCDLHGYPVTLKSVEEKEDISEMVKEDPKVTEVQKEPEDIQKNETIQEEPKKRRRKKE